MRATCWMGKADIQVRQVPDPKILNPDDAIVRITSTAICGSDLHLYNGFIPSMEKGDILGHEFMGEVVEVGREVKKLKVGDRVVVPFPIACGHCMNCESHLYSVCENSNPNAWMAEKLWGYSPAGIFGYSHMLGGYAGGQAEYARVPYADVGPIKIPDGMPRRAGALPVGHLPDRLHGRRDLQHQTRRHHRRLGLRAGRAVRHQERFHAGRRARDRHRPLPLPAADGEREGGRRNDQLRGGRQRPGGLDGK